jgi:hypothetical protein
MASNVKKHNTKVVDLLFLFNFSIWNTYFQIRKLEIWAPKYRLLNNFWVTNRFCSYAYYSLISIFQDNITIEKVIDNFTSFP